MALDLRDRAIWRKHNGTRGGSRLFLNDFRNTVLDSEHRWFFEAEILPRSDLNARSIEGARVSHYWELGADKEKKRGQHARSSIDWCQLWVTAAHHESGVLYDDC